MQHIINNISKVSRNAIIIASASLASRLLGLFRDRVLASEFGAGSILDSYYAAFRIPDFVFNLIILGALSAAFIPVFSQLLFKDEKKAWQVVNNFTNVILSFLIIILAILSFSAPWLVKIIAPGFSGNQLEMTIALTRVMLLSPIFFAISSIVGGVLNSFGRFFVYSLAPILYNIGIICGALYLVPLWGVAGLAWGVVFGAFAHMAIQIPTFIKLGYRFRPIFNIYDKNFVKILTLMLPVSISLALVQINLLVDNLIGSTLAEGSIAIINLATNLISLPVGLIGISLAVSVFPLLSYNYNHKEEENFANNFTNTFNLIIYLLIPCMVFALLLRAHVVRLILGAGLFDISDTIWTSRTLGYLALGLVAIGLIPFLARTFYAISDTKTPLKITLVAVVINIIGDIVLTKFINFNFLGVEFNFIGKVVGLALASVIAAFVNLLLLLIILNQRFPKIDFNKVFIASGKYVIFSLIAGFFLYKTLFWIEPYINTLTTIGLAAQTIFAIGVGSFIYLLLSAIFNVAEAQRLIRGVGGIFGGNGD